MPGKQPSILDCTSSMDLYKKEIVMLRKELARVKLAMQEQERETERVKKENYNLVNRYRNTLVKK